MLSFADQSLKIGKDRNLFFTFKALHAFEEKFPLSCLTSAHRLVHSALLQCSIFAVATPYIS